MKKLNKIIPIGLYPFDLMLSFNETDNQIKKALKEFKITPENATETTVFDMDKSKTKIGRMVMFIGKQTVIRLNFMPHLSDPFEMSLLQHEIFHTVGFMMSEINTPLNNDTHEVYAYLIQYLTEKIYKEL
jgi:hypothetical protein